jgi:hypothetical protein
VADQTPPSEQSIPAEALNAFGLMLTWLFASTIGVVLFIAAILLIAHFRQGDLPILAFVALSGALGGFVSSLSRLYSLKELPALLMKKDFHSMRNRFVAMYSLIPPLIGAIGAVVVYVVVAGGLIQGELFAKFECFKGEGNCDSFGGLLMFGPSTVTDYAKVLVWGFISGFSERFFPGVMESLAKQP